MKLAVIATLSLFVSLAQAQSKIFFEEWKGFSAPEIMSSGFTHALEELPLEGSILGGTNAWSGPYWASKKGGINIRWNSARKEGFDYSSPGKAAVMKMSKVELSKLSPTEKFDLMNGNYDYPVKHEAAGAASKRAKDWAGVCHGWAPASLHHAEPTPKEITNPDGIEIPFGSGDIKALLSYYYAFYASEEESTDQMGLRCFFGGWLGGVKGCGNDLNAGAFHIVIANKLGLQKEGLLMDVDRYKEVWNQPIVGFKTKIVNQNLRPTRDAAYNAVREVRVETQLFYVDESDATWNTVMGTKDQLIAKRDLTYRLEMDAVGKIVGGEWESEERPDFLWNRKKITTFDEPFNRLPELLND